MATEAPARSAVAAADDYERYERAFAGVQAPFAFVDMDAMWHNAAGMLARVGGKPIRVASKSLRCRPLLRAVLDRDPGFRGLMTFTLAETLWLAEQGLEDMLVAYPTADREGLAALGRFEGERAPIVMVDSTRQLDLIDSAAGSDRRDIRVCIDMDCSLWLAGGRVRIGPKRSPIRTPEQAASFAREITGRPGFELAGVMGYEGHIAGVGDRPAGARLKGLAIRGMQALSARELRERRGELVAAVREVAPVELVNAGGTGSLEASASEDCVTEVTAGSGFYAPALFDHYTRFALRPAAMFALPVVRRPGQGVATALGGGYLASGPPDRFRLPVPHLPRGLKLDPMEGAGEVQTPLLGKAADRLAPGDRMYLRHSKAGELCERFNSLYLVAGGEIVDEVPTYRGEGKAFL